MSNERLLVHYMSCIRYLISFLLHECQPIHWLALYIIQLVVQEHRVELHFVFSCLGVPMSLQSPHAFFRPPLVNLSETEFSTMLSEIPSVDTMRSLNPFLFAALANCFSFLVFITAASSLSRISRFSFSSGGVTIPSMISL